MRGEDGLDSLAIQVFKETVHLKSKDNLSTGLLRIFFVIIFVAGLSRAVGQLALLALLALRNEGLVMVSS